MYELYELVVIMIGMTLTVGADEYDISLPAVPRVGDLVHLSDLTVQVAEINWYTIPEHGNWGIRIHAKTLI